MSWLSVESWLRLPLLLLWSSGDGDRKIKIKNKEGKAKLRLSPQRGRAEGGERDGEIKREQFSIVPSAQLVPKVTAFMKFQTLA